MWAYLQDCDLEKGWDSSYSSPLLQWRARVERYRPFRRAGREVSVVFFMSVTRPADLWVELCVGMDEKLTKSLWIGVQGRAEAGVITMGVCCRFSDQEDQAGQSLCRQRGQALQSQALVVFNHHNICSQAIE